jgi:hypothetical protein
MNLRKSLTARIDDGTREDDVKKSSIPAIIEERADVVQDLGVAANGKVIEVDIDGAINDDVEFMFISSLSRGENDVS